MLNFQPSAHGSVFATVRGRVICYNADTKTGAVATSMPGGMEEAYLHKVGSSSAAPSGLPAPAHGPQCKPRVTCTAWPRLHPADVGLRLPTATCRPRTVRGPRSCVRAPPALAAVHSHPGLRI